MKATQFRAEWRDPPETEEVVKELLVGEVLNFPCGESLIGDVRADIGATAAANRTADLNEPLAYFDEREFETVYCDPPWAFYAYDRQYDWVLDVWKIADKRLILNQPLNSLRLPKANRSYYICDTPGGMAMTLLGVYDNPNETLPSFGIGEEVGE